MKALRYRLATFIHLARNTWSYQSTLMQLWFWLKVFSLFSTKPAQPETEPSQ